MEHVTAASLRERREAVMRAHVEAERRGDIEATIATFARPRYELVGPRETYDGADAVRAMHTELSTAFLEFELEEIALRHCDDAVVVEGWVTGIHRAPFRGLPPTGRRLRYRTLALFLFEDDRLVCERVYFDTLEILDSLGFGLEAGSPRAALAFGLAHPARLTAAIGRGIASRFRRST